MTKSAMPTVAYLRQRLSYCQNTGVMTWIARPLSDFSGARPQSIYKVWNTRFAGMPAGRVTNGRRSIRIDGKDYIYARIAFAVHHGAFPIGDIDHINGDSCDDRIENLRDVPRSLNNRNKAAKPGISGYVGVTFHRKNGSWRASMSINNKTIYIGYFKTPEAAFAARLAAQTPFGFTERHTRT